MPQRIITISRSPPELRTITPRNGLFTLFRFMAELSAIFREARVGSILPFLRKTGIAFDDYATKAIGQAFDAACIALHDSGQPQIVYEVIAKRIIDAAKGSEPDVDRLRDAGLAALGVRSEGEGRL